MTLRSRIAAAGGLAVLVALLAASFVIYPAADRDLHEQLDTTLVNTAASAPKFAKQLKSDAGKSSSGTSNASGGDPTAPLTVGDTLIQFLSEPVYAGMPNALTPVTPADVQVADQNQAGYFQTIQYRGQAYQMYTVAFPGDLDILVRVARPESAVSAPLNRLCALLAALVLGGVLVAAATARLLAGRVLRPVRALTDTVERVTETRDLTARVDGPGVDAAGRDEIGRLARSFAAMMAALDASIRTQRRLVADASHELRTPLTSLTTNLELLAEPGGLADPHAPALVGAAREQSGELKGLINDLVDLARYGETEAHLEDLRLDLAAAEVVERAAKRVPGLRFETVFEECFVRADADAVARALGNLVDNAVKWSPPGGTVRALVTVVAGPVADAKSCAGAGAEASVGGRAGVATDEVCFSVQDEGPGIPEADLPFVFDRFYRSTEARSMPGSGLGLSIVRQIAGIHGGRVSAQPLATGVRMELFFPRV
jgi:two-component system, OmpR family, sensor histidine kinase MprB